ncbi:hypothetical protein PAMA_015813 [Pampus argenteus]
MLSNQQSVFFIQSVGFYCFVLLVTVTSSLKPEGKHPSQPIAIDARLVEGGSRCSGRLEMKHREEWRTLNIIEYIDTARTKVNYAQVACRQMGCGSVISIIHNTNNANRRPAWEVNFRCSATDMTLSECGDPKARRRVEEKSTSTSSVEVICSESVRLVGASQVCSGRVEVYSDQGWAPVCEDGFHSEVKQVVCREFGCGPPVSSKTSFLRGDESVSSKKFQCKGSESRLQDCATSTHNNCTPASGISCTNDYDVRLVGGESRCEGTLEEKHHLEWRPVGDVENYFITKKAVEVCQQLDCGNKVSGVVHRLPQRQHVWTCRGFHCRTKSEGSSASLTNVTCAGTVRLAGGDNTCSGRLEVKSGPSWASVCQLSLKTAQVTCRDLECGFPLHFVSRISSETNKEHAQNLVFNCEGDEDHLLDCPADTTSATEENCGLRETYLKCIEHPEEPSVIIHTPQYAFAPDYVFKGQRFVISCSANTDDATVISIRLKSDSDPPTEWIQTGVNSTARFLFPAAQDKHEGVYKCDYNYNIKPDVFSTPSIFHITVKELHDVRLVDGRSSCAGRLEMEYRDEWNPVSYQHSWSLKEAAVVCAQLGCGSAVSTGRVSNSTELLPAWRFYSDCDGSERTLTDCGTVRKWRSSYTVEVVCTDILVQPNITVYSSQSDDQDEPIIKGYSFTVKCFVQPQYPGGHFTLIFNQTHHQSQPAVNHSSNFVLTAAEESRGNYSCVYHNFIFNHNFSSESQRISIYFTQNTDVMLDDGGFWHADSAPCAGKLFVQHEGEKKLLSAESTVWDLKHASVVCRQLGCGEAVSTKSINLPTKESMWRFFSDCDGSESVLMQCGTAKEWFSSSYVEVACTG